MYDSLSAGGDLVHAVLLMKQRMATEEEGRRFHVDDLIMPPHRFSERMSVRVSYRGAPRPRTHGPTATSLFFMT